MPTNFHESARLFLYALPRGSPNADSLWRPFDTYSSIFSAPLAVTSLPHEPSHCNRSEGQRKFAPRNQPTGEGKIRHLLLAYRVDRDEIKVCPNWVCQVWSNALIERRWLVLRATVGNGEGGTCPNCLNAKSVRSTRCCKG